jgi:D-threo-aldose 1-dehydrogenase
MSRPERVASTVELASIDIPAEVWDEIDALGPADQVDPEADRFPELKRES